MSVREESARNMERLCDDDSHGYAQDSRWGPDYDCSSAVIDCAERAGAPVKEAGATYTGNMKPAFLACGYEDVTAEVALSGGDGLLRGDVLLNIRHHTAMYLGGGIIGQASINERGTVSGGQPGDQTGSEIGRRSYYNFPWDCVLRYREASGTEETPEAPEIPAAVCAPELPELSEGRTGGAVLAVQALLERKWAISCGPCGLDGEFGPCTRAAVESFQRARGLDADGVCGARTWAALIGGAA